MSIGYMYDCFACLFFNGLVFANWLVKLIIVDFAIERIYQFALLSGPK